MDDLFINLQKYKVNEHNSPMENFFTEIFAYLLNNNKEYCARIIALFSDSKIVVSKKFDIKTQVHHGINGQTDLEIQYEDTWIIVEIKVNSSQNDGQLNKYLDILKGNKKPKIIYLSKYFEDIYIKIDELKIDDAKNRIKKIYWHDIYNITTDFGETDVLFKNFISLMKDSNMTPFEKITKEQIEGFNNTKNNIYKLFDKLINDNDNIKKSGNTLTLKDWKNSTFSIEKKFYIKSLTINLFFNGEGIYIYVDSNQNDLTDFIKENFFTEDKGDNFYNYGLCDANKDFEYQNISKIFNEIMEKLSN